MTLYEIDSRIEECWTSVVNPETGEIDTESLDWKELEALEMARDEKLEGVGKWVKDLTAQNDALDAEIKRLQARKKSNETKVKGLKGYLRYALNDKKWNCGTVAVSFLKTEAVEVADGAELPEEYLTVKVTKAPNKVLIKEALKAGKEIAGATLKNNVSCIVK